MKNLLSRILLIGLIVSSSAFAREIEYQDQEVAVNVLPGQPTVVSFPSTIKSGFAKKMSGLDFQKKENDIIIFAQEGLDATGEGVVVRLVDGRSFSIRVKLADDQSPRDDVVMIEDYRTPAGEEAEGQPYNDKKYAYAPATTVSGMMREMMLWSEFGKKNIPGYRASNKHQGETILNDGALLATIDTIFIGPDLWGYVLNAQNMLDQNQKLNPATFRLDGTRAISATKWELAPRALNVEQQISQEDKTKIYVITSPKRYN